MSYRSILALTIVIFVTFADSQNYCSSNLCASGRTHIACGNNGKFKANCPANARMVPTNSIKDTLKKLHNQKRNLIAGGGLNGYQPAVRMATMQWDDELARLAALNVKQCQMKHDQCRNTNQFKMSGQNLAILSYTGKENSKTLNQLLVDRVNAWWNEYKNANMNIIRKYPSGYSGPQIGHFTVMVRDSNIRLGCAASRYKHGKWNRFLLACNYATTNIIGNPLYAAGAKASKCTRGKNPIYPNLCSVNEQYSGL